MLEHENIKKRLKEDIDKFGITTIIRILGELAGKKSRTARDDKYKFDLEVVKDMMWETEYQLFYKSV